MDWVNLLQALLSGSLGVAIFIIGRKTASHEKGKETGIILTEIGHIKASIEEIKRQNERQGEQYLETLTRLTAVEASAKQAHKRLDEMKGVQS